MFKLFNKLCDKYTFELVGAFVIAFLILMVLATSTLENMIINEQESLDKKVNYSNDFIIEVR